MLLAGGAFVLTGGQSVSERVSAYVDADASCQKWGLREIAGEREPVYDCSFRWSDSTLAGFTADEQHDLIQMERVSGGTRICVAIIDGAVTAELGKC